MFRRSGPGLNLDLSVYMSVRRDRVSEAVVVSMVACAGEQWLWCESVVGVAVQRVPLSSS